AADALGLSPGWLVRAATLALAVALAAALLRAPVLPLLAGVGALAAAFGAYEADYVFGRFAVPATTRASTLPAEPRDWIDSAAPADVALLPNPYLGREFWWDAELWNKRVTNVLRLRDDPIFTPFPA